MKRFALAGLSVAITTTGCRTTAAPLSVLPEGVEAISLLGDTLRAPVIPDVTRAVYEARLDSARRALAANPDDPDALIWLGRRTAYLGRYREAIGIFTRASARWPDDARFLRHRGHRWITVREFGRAVEDLERAARLVQGRSDEIEPDGLPNARGIPTSTLQTNIYYHLGLAHYLRGDLARARRAFEAWLARSGNADMAVAARYWLYLTLRRAGDRAGAARAAERVTRELDIIENGSYHRLLLVFRGLVPLDSLTAFQGLDGATTSFGLGAWFAAEGDQARAREYFGRARQPGQWAAFGFIAAAAAPARSRC